MGIAAVRPAFQGERCAYFMSILLPNTQCQNEATGVFGYCSEHMRRCSSCAAEISYEDARNQYCPRHLWLSLGRHAMFALGVVAFLLLAIFLFHVELARLAILAIGVAVGITAERWRDHDALAAYDKVCMPSQAASMACELNKLTSDPAEFFSHRNRVEVAIRDAAGVRDGRQISEEQPNSAFGDWRLKDGSVCHWDAEQRRFVPH